MIIVITENEERLRKELYDHLTAVFHQFGLGHCSGKLKLSKRFLKKHAENESQYRNMIRLLEYHGGFCDCEVCFNVYEPWEIGREVEIESSKIQ
ncbi:MAG: DUF2695 domain-containing protein [Eubacterium sp.]|nr:DUF2695 domain-containing protein [Eubacterium sp.]